MVREVMEGLGTNVEGWIVDCTLGMGGHSVALLEANPGTRVLGVDRDGDALEIARDRLSVFGKRFLSVHADFKDVEEWRGHLPEPPVGIIVDLGLSTYQLRAGRGFSFSDVASLDMRMDPGVGEPASAFIAKASEERLKEVLRKYGEETHARRIARAIVEARAEGPIESAASLSSIVADAVPKRPGRRIHPATRTFQALRIYVNRELEGLGTFIRKAVETLDPRGRLAVLAYHSLEDRIVKRTFRELCIGCTCPPELPVCVCGKKPSLRLVFRGAGKPSLNEIERNPASRSARLRVGEKL